MKPANQLASSNHDATTKGRSDGATHPLAGNGALQIDKVCDRRFVRWCHSVRQFQSPTAHIQVSIFPTARLRQLRQHRTPAGETHVQGPEPRTTVLQHCCTQSVWGCGPFFHSVCGGLGARIRWGGQGVVSAARTAHTISAAASTSQHCQTVSNTSWRACSRIPSAVSTSPACTFNAGRNRTLSFAPAHPTSALASASRPCARRVASTRSLCRLQSELW